MATYKISYIIDHSYSKPGDIYVSDVIDENDAIELAIYKYGLDDSKTITNVTLISE